MSRAGEILKLVEGAGKSYFDRKTFGELEKSWCLGAVPEKDQKNYLKALDALEKAIVDMLDKLDAAGSWLVGRGTAKRFVDTVKKCVINSIEDLGETEVVRAAEINARQKAGLA